MSTDNVILRMCGIHKRFSGVHALKGVDLELRQGEVLALLGENGAGKSTLIKMLGGAHLPSEGHIELEGKKVELVDPLESQHQGIGIIYQEFNLIPHLTVRENIFLGREIKKGGVIQRKEESKKAEELFEKLGVSIDPNCTCHKLSIAEQQIVEIAKALSQNIKILVMDEPSATLTPLEVEGLFRVIRDLKQRGISIIYISHRLDEIYEICDRITVLRDGEYIGSRPIADVSRSQMIEMMVGRSVENEFPKQYHDIGEIALEVKNLSYQNKVRNVSFKLHRGEVLGLTGLVGAGRTELARLIFGAEMMDEGEVIKDGKTLKMNSPRDAIGQGICLLTEDRKSQGLVLIHSVQENFALPNMRDFSNNGILTPGVESRAFEGFAESIKIKISGPSQKAGNLSGGNQQKVVLAKWLQRNCDILIIDEPTRGIDVGAKYEIYMLMNQLALEGKAILMISSELPEVLGMSDRILVMRQGEISGEIKNPNEATQQSIMEYAIH